MCVAGVQICATAVLTAKVALNLFEQQCCRTNSAVYLCDNGLQAGLYVCAAGMRVRLEPSPEDEGSWLVADVGIAYGGVAPKSIMAEQVGLVQQQQCVFVSQVSFTSSRQFCHVLKTPHSVS
jgi:hypothetical protein